MPLILTHLNGFNAGSSTPDVILTSLGASLEGGALSSSWTSDSFAVTANLPVVAMIHTRRGTGGISVTSCTIGGFAATQLAASPAGNDHVSIWGASVTGLTSIDVAAEFSLSTSGPYFRAWSLTNLLTLSARDTISDTGDPASGTIDCPAGGVIIGGGTNNTNTTHTWTGITEIVDAYSGGTYNYTQASDAFATAQTGLTIECNPASASTLYMAAVSLR